MLEFFFELSHCSHAPLFSQCHYPWQALEKLRDYLKYFIDNQSSLMQGTVSPEAYLVNAESIFIGEGTVVEPGAYLQGPCVIGRGCTIRHGAYLRGDVLACDGCVIGHDTEIKHSILLEGAAAAHFAYLGDTILGAKVNLGAGVKCANLRLDRAPITVHFAGQRFETGLKKLGALVGDGAQIGCNVVLNPGTLVGKEVACAPSLNLGGYIPSSSFVKGTSSYKICSPSPFKS